VLVVVVVFVFAGKKTAQTMTLASRTTRTSTSTEETEAVVRATRNDEVRRGLERAMRVAVPGLVTISGRVVEVSSHAGVSGAEVVARGVLGESTAMTGGDGTFSIAVVPGDYRLAVRGAGVLSAGIAERPRLDGGPSAEQVASPEDSVMPAVRAIRDVGGVELAVWRDTTIEGEVVDTTHAAMAHVIVRADGSLRPASGSDVTETDAHGRFTLHVAPGQYSLHASYGVFVETHAPAVDTTAAPASVTIEMVAGCEVRGRVVHADGTPAADGALERGYGNDLDVFAPAGRIEADGTFHWVTGETGADVALRAWPWKSPPTPAQRFACTPGARFDGVELRLPDAQASITGTIVDSGGAPVPDAYLDIEALDPGGFSQQERGDGDGHWQVFDMPPGHYRITATAAGRGVVADTVVAPSSDVALVLSGTGRIEGSAAGLASGSFEASFVECSDMVDTTGRGLAVAREPRVVAVADGKFEIDDAPACQLVLAARSLDRTVRARVAVAAGSTANVALSFQ
jgi:hypothetical protein